MVNRNEFRIAPTRNGKLAAGFWKFFIYKNEIYASARGIGGESKVSVHRSGQIHTRTGERDIVTMRPLTLFGNSEWQHALQLRFVPSEESMRPNLDALGHKHANIVEIPADSVLILDLLVSTSERESSLPPDFVGTKVLWKSQRADGCHVAVIGKVTPIDATARERRDRLTKIDKVGVSVTDGEGGYAELHDFHWSERGNFVFVIPMPPDMFCLESNATRDPGSTKKTFEVLTVSSGQAIVTITAPNGASVATLSFLSSEQELSFYRETATEVQLCFVKLCLRAEGLIRGLIFKTSGFDVRAIPAVQGKTPPNWRYIGHAEFDGENLHVRIQPVCFSLRNENGSMTRVGNDEEVFITTPNETLLISATFSAPEKSVPLMARMLLRTRQ